ncbi:hypothetical protein V8C34DRAFT_322386 [Trichoderma compactum]
MEKLLLPLVADDDMIAELLKHQGAIFGKIGLSQNSLRSVLKALMSYMQYIQSMRRVLDKINRELLIASEWAQKLLANLQLTSRNQMKLKAFFSRDGLAHRVYKFKLCNNEAVRKRLFGELQEYNDKLERPLRASDEDLRISTHRKAYQALASAWTCQCQQHDAKLLLQHRVAGKAEFDITLNELIAADWLVGKIRVLEVDDPETARLDESITVPIHHSSRTQSYPDCSPSSSVTLTCATASSSRSTTHEILGICALFESPGKLRYGYLTYRNCRYYVYNIQPHGVKRHTLSLIIASTYLQLLEFSWLPPSPKRADFLFPKSNYDATLVKTDQPHISQNLSLINKQDTLSASENSFHIAEAFDHLGILLLELCFGRILEDQPWRRRLPAGENNIEKAGYDVLAAREWSVAPEKWRQEMLRRVIRPLERNRDYVITGGVSFDDGA